MSSQAAATNIIAPQIRPSFLEAIRRLETQIDTTALRSLLAQGRIEDALDAVERVAKTVEA